MDEDLHILRPASSIDKVRLSFRRDGGSAQNAGVLNSESAK